MPCTTVFDVNGCLVVASASTSAPVAVAGASPRDHCPARLGAFNAAISSGYNTRSADLHVVDITAHPVQVVVGVPAAADLQGALMFHVEVKAVVAAGVGSSLM